MSERLIVALDFPNTAQASELVETLGETVSFYKIGLELLFNDGQRLAENLLKKNKRLFIDAKLLDIGNTVKKATSNIATLNADFLTIHITDRKTLDAAVEGRGHSSLKLLGVTVMTNLEHRDLEEQGIKGMAPEDLVCHRAELAKNAGLDGVVASANEAEMIRRIVGPDFLIVTPGIRPSGMNTDDQSRVMTPGQAIQKGSDYLVVGRPITEAENPLTAVQLIVDEIKRAV